MTETAATATHNNHHIPVAIKDFRGFIANVLRTHDWQDIQTPRDYKRVTATQEDEKRGQHSNWSLKFKLTITYRKAEDGNTILNYELVQKKSNQQKSCEDKLFELMKSVHELALDAAETAAEAEEPNAYGSAKFADEAELRKRGYISNTVDPKRLLLAPWGENEFITVPTEFTNMHGMVCGPTGAGKSSGFFVPNLSYRTATSMIVTEATAGGETPDLFLKTSGWRQFKGSKVYFFNPSYARGTRINPLDKLKYVSDGEFAQVADELANLVIINTTPPNSSRTDPIWDKSEKHLLWIMIMHVARSKQAELANFGTIRELLRQPDKQIRQILQSSNSSVAREEYDSFLHHSSENFRHGVFSGLLQRMNPWLNSVVQTMTSTTDLDLSQLQNQNFTFYLSVPSRERHVKPIAALIFNFILDLALSKNFKYPPALMLDEFTNFGAIPGIDEALAIIRKRNLPVVLGFQTERQLVTTYGENVAKQITSQLATRIFFRPRDAKDAQDLSKMLDSQTIIEKKTDDRGYTSVRELGKPLMSVRDIHTLPPSEVLIMTESTNPLRVARFDYRQFPPPTGFDMPDLAEHKLIQVEKLNDATLDMQTKKAREKAQQENDFSSFESSLSQSFASAKKRHVLTSPKNNFSDPDPVQDYEKPAPAPPRNEEAVQTKQVKKEEPKTKKKPAIQIDPDDDWDVPG